MDWPVASVIIAVIFSLSAAGIKLLPQKREPNQRQNHDSELAKQVAQHGQLLSELAIHREHHQRSLDAMNNRLDQVFERIDGLQNTIREWLHKA